jgi:hypothetical protein
MKIAWIASINPSIVVGAVVEELNGCPFTSILPPAAGGVVVPATAESITASAVEVAVGP